jgi:hypothetical protein
MWDAIKSDATDKSEVHRTQVKCRLHELKYDGTVGAIRSHLNSLTEAHDELLSMGLTVDDFTPIIINSLPKSYHNLVLAISGANRTGGGNLDTEKLIVLLTEEDDYCKSEQKKGKSKSDNHALNVNKGKNAKRAKCDNCGRTGHSTPNCYQPGGTKEGQAPWQKDQSQKDQAKSGNQTKSANKTTNSSKANDKKSSGAYAFTVFEHRQLHALATNAEKTEAAVDSGASVHYCPNRKKFKTYETIAEQKIYAADGRSLSAIGKGDVEVNLLNDGHLTMVTLRNVYHVPEMTTTLILVACLDKAGFIVHFGQGLCRIESPDNQIIAEIPL